MSIHNAIQNNSNTWCPLIWICLDRSTTNFQIFPLQIHLHVLVHAGVPNLWVQQSSLCSILPDFKVCQATFVEKVVEVGHSDLIGKVSTYMNMCKNHIARSLIG